MPAVIPDVGSAMGFHPDHLERLSDTLRESAQRLRNVPELLTKVRQEIAAVEKARDDLWNASSQAAARKFSMERLISCLLLSGAMRNSAKLKIAVSHAINILCPEPGLKDWLIQMVDADGALPGRSTL